MNKYFLSIIFILAIFQSFKVFAEVFFTDKKIKKFNNIIRIPEIFQVHQFKQDNSKEVVDVKETFEMTNIENGKRLFNKCSSCLDISFESKIKVGPPLWKIVGKDFVKNEKFKYSNNFGNPEKIWYYKEIFYFLDNLNKYISNTKMNYGGIFNEVDRVDLITYQSLMK